MRLNTEDSSTGVSPGIPPANTHYELQSPIASFPTSNQPVLYIHLKEMLLTLHRSLHTDFTNLTHKFSAELSTMGDRVDQVENATTDIITTVKDLTDANEENEEERLWLCAKKIADLEDRPRRSNLKLRRIPESVPAQDLMQCTK